MTNVTGISLDMASNLGLACRTISEDSHKRARLLEDNKLQTVTEDEVDSSAEAQATY